MSKLIPGIIIAITINEGVIIIWPLNVPAVLSVYTDHHLLRREYCGAAPDPVIKVKKK